jgi:hypothetical protein
LQIQFDAHNDAAYEGNEAINDADLLLGHVGVQSNGKHRINCREADGW